MIQSTYSKATGLKKKKRSKKIITKQIETVNKCIYVYITYSEQFPFHFNLISSVHLIHKNMHPFSYMGRKRTI